MPNLSHEASAEYWSEFPDPSIYRVITFLESVEDWTQDGDEILEMYLKKLGDELDNIEQIDMESLNHEDHFIRIIANIKTSRGLRLLQAIDSVHPGSASRVLVHAEENNMNFNDSPSIFLKRNIAFERLRLLSRVFSEYRLNLVARALEGEE